MGKRVPRPSEPPPARLQTPTVRGEAGPAEQAYREALRLDPAWVPAYANFADLYRQTGRDDEGSALLRGCRSRIEPRAGRPTR
ncbi:MAG: hypothetical protein PHT19_11400 [Methylococcus sp.]|nr:hypothetical protein [Methylococcus sp.]